MTVLIALALAASIALGVRHVREVRIKRRREAEYQTVLRTYRDSFKMGISRKELEDYLSSRRIPFQHMCCVNMKEYSKATYDDLVKIGSEPVPWFCSENNVYIGFDFRGRERGSPAPTAEALDLLTDIKIFHWLEGCM